MATSPSRPRPADVFDPARSDEADPPDLTGGHRAPRRFIGWQGFFGRPERRGRLA